MNDGLYEILLDEALEEALKDKNRKTRTVDSSETANVVSLEYQKRVRKIINQIDEKDRKKFISELTSHIGSASFVYTEKPELVELIGMHDDQRRLKQLLVNRPKSSIATSTLFTGQGSLSLVSELKREIRTSDRIDFLISFIKHSGLRLIFDDLVEFTKDKKLRVITTSYMGASDYKAIKMLAELPNTEVKISYDVNRTRLHAKAYYFERNTGFSTAYIGSSNMSNAALSDGLEWNLKISEYTSKDVMNKFKMTFETYWNDDEFTLFDPRNDEHLAELQVSLNKEKDENTPHVFFDLKPYSYQKEILEDLERERQLFKSYKNIIVAATGTGKTMVAAFDYRRFKNENNNHKILFLAHRKEILQQSLETFRAVLKDYNFGELWGDGKVPTSYDYIFATIQTFVSRDNYKNFKRDYFDYVVIDETHHASAATYLKIIDYFTPEILLGLTATPERMDGEDILEYFNGRIASEIRLTEAINRKLLSPFHYFGITDPEDLSHMKWKRGGYDVDQLTNVYTKSKQRVQVIINAINRYLESIETMKAVGFCVSIPHANFMAEAFNLAGIPAISLHSESLPSDRELAKQKLQKGEIKVIFTVDLFNEGVDIPEINTVLFLRPTESLTVFLQQLGRGLRLVEGKDALTVLDFVGRAHANYDFSMKFRALIGRTHRSLEQEIQEEFPNMPAGSHIHLEKVAQNYILQNIQSATINKNKLIYMLRSFSENSTQPLTLENFLSFYNIERDQFYKSYSFRKLLFNAGITDNYQSGNEKELKSALRRFARVDSRRFLLFAKRLLEEGININNLNQAERKLLSMFHFTIWGDIPKESFKESLRVLMEDNTDLVLELKELIDYNLKHQRVLEKPYEVEYVPLDIHASYSVDQILAAFSKNTEDHKYPMRQGVLYVEEENTDLFFVTINKLESDYLPTTLYNDYAINNQLFHWESQSTTSTTSPTGQRYINDRSENHKVLFFVREKKNQHGSASPYVFLGNAKYISHSGNNPIQMVWKLDHLIPERIILESKLKMVE